jgi:hypothetical protein
MPLRRYSVEFDNSDEPLDNVGLEELFHPRAPHAHATAHVNDADAADPSPNATATEVVNEALQDEADAEERSAKRPRDMELDAADEDSDSRMPVLAPPPPAPTQAELLSALTKEAIDDMNFAQLKGAASKLGLSHLGLKRTLRKRLKHHLEPRSAASGCSNSSLASISNPPAPPAQPPGRTVAIEAGAALLTLRRAPVLDAFHAHNAIADADAVLEHGPTPTNAAAAAIAGTPCMILFDGSNWYSSLRVSLRLNQSSY